MPGDPEGTLQMIVPYTFSIYPDTKEKIEDEM
jgi:hypothetical protein